MEKIFRAFDRNVIAIVCAFSLWSHTSAQENDWEHYYWGTYVYTGNWEQTADIVTCRNVIYWVFTMGKRVAIQGREYTSVICEPMPVPTTKRRTMDDNRWYALGIRKEGGRVYANLEEYMDYLSRPFNWENEQPSFGTPDYLPYYTTEDGEVILYDYNMEVGDKYLSVEGHGDICVVKKDKIILTDGREHRRLTLNNGLVLIEDIGCINGFLLDYLNPLPQFTDYFCCLLNVLGMDGDIFYVTDLTIIDEEHPVFINIMTTDHLVPISDIYDFQGRRLAREPEKGLYIKNGRKYLKR